MLIKNINLKSSSSNWRRFFVFIMLVFFASCTNDVKEVKQTIADPNALAETGKNVELLFTENALAAIKIKAPTAVRHESDNPFTEFPDGMQLFVYNELGEIDSELTAKYGRMNDGSTEMLAKEDVVVINKTGEQLNTEELLWDQEAAVIKSEGFVKITTPTEIIYGNGFEANDNFTEYTIFNITGTVQVEEGEF